MSSRQPDQIVLFLDESIDSSTLAEALTATGISVQRALRVVLTRDRRIGYRQLEKQALQEAGLKAFVFTGGNATVAQTTEILIKALPKMKALCATHNGPFIYHIGKGAVPIKVS